MIYDGKKTLLWSGRVWKNGEKWGTFYCRHDCEVLRDQLNDLRANDLSSAAEAAAEGGKSNPMEENRLKELEEIVRNKNKQIHQLLGDIEEVYSAIYLNN